MTAYEQGYASFERGDVMACCPYHRYDSRGIAWRNGWKDANHRYNAVYFSFDAPLSYVHSGRFN